MASLQPPQRSLELSVANRSLQASLFGLGVRVITGEGLFFAREVFPRGFGEIMKQLPTRHPHSLARSRSQIYLCGPQVGAGRGADAGAAAGEKPSQSS